MGGGGGGAEEELTAQETALYDRQIRVWGVDAQKRLSKAHVLVCGVNGTTIEFCKNIVLAGVGSLSLMDDHVVIEDDLNSNFLIPHDESIYGGRSRADVCCQSLKDFNPMVRVDVAKGDPSLIDGEFIDKFDIIVVSCASLKTKLFINDNCRKRNKHIAFYSIECKDSCGEIFVDLQNHSYVQSVTIIMMLHYYSPLVESCTITGIPACDLLPESDHTLLDASIGKYDSFNSDDCNRTSLLEPAYDLLKESISHL
ncbi:hypothetical protein ACQ4PT_045690 [Festuca glaucescens]